MLFNLTYEELLTRRQGIYEQVIFYSNYFLWCYNIMGINLLGYSRQSGNGCPANERES